MRSRMPSLTQLSRRKGRQTRPKVRLASHTDSNKIGIILRSFRHGTFHFRRTPRNINTKLYCQN